MSASLWIHNNIISKANGEVVYGVVTLCECVCMLLWNGALCKKRTYILTSTSLENVRRFLVGALTKVQHVMERGSKHFAREGRHFKVSTIKVKMKDHKFLAITSKLKYSEDLNNKCWLPYVIFTFQRDWSKSYWSVYVCLSVALFPEDRQLAWAGSLLRNNRERFILLILLLFWLLLIWYGPMAVYCKYGDIPSGSSDKELAS
jgi:hypothetical protein